MRLVKHFYELDRGRSEKPNNHEGLDEAAKAYEDGLGYYECMNQWPSVAFKAGAEWQKEQMMKEAVEADIMLTLHDKTGDISLHTGYLPQKLGIKCSDKVRIIIVKED